jgi:hypothetical protein
MTVSLIRVRSLTWATLRPARSRASAKAAPMDTPRRHSLAAPRTPPGQDAVPGPSGHAIPTADRLPRPASGEPPSQPTTGTPTAVPAPAPRLPEHAPGAGRCDPGDQLHGPHRRPGALPVPVPPAATGPPAQPRASTDHQASPRPDLPTISQPHPTSAPSAPSRQHNPPTRYPHTPGRQPPPPPAPLAAHTHEPTGR